MTPVTPAPHIEAAPAAPRASRLDPALHVLGFVVSLGLAAMSALYEVFLSALYLGSVRLPVAIVVAIGCNLGLVWFTAEVTGRRLAVAGPALLWTVIMVTASTRTTEGDLVLISSNWVALGTMLAGSIAFAAGAYRLILAGVRPPRSSPAPPG